MARGKVQSVECAQSILVWLVGQQKKGRDQEALSLDELLVGGGLATERKVCLEKFKKRVMGVNGKFAT